MSLETARRYFALIEHDEKVLRVLTHASSAASTDTSDWQIAILYYVLCLYLKALGRCRGKELQDHYSIKQWINSEPDLLVIARPYRKAEEWSRDARYEGRLFSSPEKSRFVQWFVTVRDHVDALFKKAGAADMPKVDPAVILPSVP